MKTKITRSQAPLFILAMLAIIFSGMFFINNSSQKNKLKKEKIRSEALLSEKLELEKDMGTFQKEMASLKNKSARLDQKLKEIGEQLAMKESEVKKLNAERVSARDLKKKNAELEALRQQMEKEIDDLTINMSRLMAEYNSVTQQLENLQASNDLLNLKNAMLEALLSDNFQAEALKGKNEKLTVQARKANTLVSSFDVPAGMGKQLYFKVVTPEGSEISSQDYSFASIRIHEYDDSLMASLSGGSTKTGTFSKRAELVYKPEQRLTKGTYRFQVYDGELYMGSVQLRLK